MKAFYLNQCEYPLLVCEVCNYNYFQTSKSKRVHPCPNCACHEVNGVSLFEWNKTKQREQANKLRQRAKDKAMLKPPTKYTIPKTSQKGLSRKTALDAIKHEVKDEHVNEYGFIPCGGCGVQFRKEQIQSSHKASVGARFDLSHDKENLTCMCDSCHKVFENGNISDRIKLKCFISEMAYLHEKHYLKFSKIFDLVLDEFERTKGKEIERIVQALERLG